MVYITQLKQQKIKKVILIRAMCCKPNITFLIFAVLVAWCRPCCHCTLF